MSRHSYKWDIIHVQRGAAACGDQEPASRGTTRLYSNCPWAILLLTYGTPQARTVRGDSDPRVDHGT